MTSLRHFLLVIWHITCHESWPDGAKENKRLPASSWKPETVDHKILRLVAIFLVYFDTLVSANQTNHQVFQWMPILPTVTIWLLTNACFELYVFQLPITFLFHTSHSCEHLKVQFEAQRFLEYLTALKHISTLWYCHTSLYHALVALEAAPQDQRSHHTKNSKCILARFS